MNQIKVPINDMTEADIYAQDAKAEGNANQRDLKYPQYVQVDCPNCGSPNGEANQGVTVQCPRCDHEYKTPVLANAKLNYRTILLNFGRTWLEIRKDVARWNNRAIDRVEVAKVTGYDRVYSGTPEAIGQVEIDYFNVQFKTMATAVYGVDPQGAAILMAN